VPTNVDGDGSGGVLIVHMLKVEVQRDAASLLHELEQRGLVVKLDTGAAAERHWHVGYPKRPGVLEITDLGDACELKVSAKRDGGWATDLVHELADGG